MHQALIRRLERDLDERKAEGLEREIPEIGSAEGLTNLADNDYLGLSFHPSVKQAAKDAIGLYGTSSSASPLISGYGKAHENLLDTLLSWHEFEYGIIWNSGYAANQALLASLPQKGDIVLADRLIHNSMISGLLRSGARIARYRHCNLDHLEELLDLYVKQGRISFVVTESVFSMDGDFPDLKRLARLKQSYNFIWILDEAHSLGWYGEKGNGLAEEYGVAKEVDVLVGTLGKSLGSMGAYTLFHDERLKRFLVNFSGEFIYSTYLAPSCAATAQASIRIVEEDSAPRASGRKLSRRVRTAVREMGFHTDDTDSPIISIVLGDISKTMGVAKALQEDGFLIGSIRPPTVPENTSRLRISLKANLGENVVEQLIASLERNLS